MWHQTKEAGGQAWENPDCRVQCGTRPQGGVIHIRYKLMTRSRSGLFITDKQGQYRLLNVQPCWRMFYFILIVVVSYSHDQQCWHLWKHSRKWHISLRNVLQLHLFPLCVLEQIKNIWHNFTQNSEKYVQDNQESITMFTQRHLRSFFKNVPNKKWSVKTKASQRGERWRTLFVQIIRQLCWIPGLWVKSLSLMSESDTRSIGTEDGSTLRNALQLMLKWTLLINYMELSRDVRGVEDVPLAVVLAVSLEKVTSVVRRKRSDSQKYLSEFESSFSSSSSFHPSIFYRFSETASRGQQFKQRRPDLPLPRHFLQPSLIIQLHTEQT